MSRLSLPVIATLIASFTVPCAAQNCFYNGGAIPTSAGATNAPFGPNIPTQPNVRYQFLISKNHFQNAPVEIRGLALWVSYGIGTLECQHLTVKLGVTPSTTLSTTFAANQVGPMQTVLDAAQYSWPFAVASDWLELGLQSPYLYQPSGGNLLVEVEATGMPTAGRPRFVNGPTAIFEAVVAEYAGSTTPTVGTVTNARPAVRVCSNAAALNWLGTGCPGSNGVAPALGFVGSGHVGSVLDVVLSGALPNELAVIMFGYDSQPPFPLELASLGMPNCMLYFDVASALGKTTDALGIAHHQLYLPLSSTLAGHFVFAQYLAHDPLANAAGFTVSNYGRIQVGY